jgi:small GTP-binding protein
MIGYKDYDELIKIVIIGDAGVGKSAIMSRQCDDVYQPSYISTIGVDFRYCVIPSHDKKIKMQIWDTAGQERFRTIITAYYRGANGVLVVFDVTRMESFKHTSYWISECKKHNQQIGIILIGNKCDSEKRMVPRETAEEFAKENNLIYVETSAKDNLNVQEAFAALADKLAGTTVVAKTDKVEINKPFYQNKCC